MVNSRAKGARGERAARDAVREHWKAPECVRTAQISGKFSSDLTGALPGAHLEVKSVGRIHALRYMDQARRDAGKNIPVVVMREDRGPWVVVVQIKDSPEFARLLMEQLGEAR